MQLHSSEFETDVSENIKDMFNSYSRNRIYNFTNIVSQNIYNQTRIRLDDIEWDKILVPTTFVVNLDYHYPYIVLVILNSDCEISFEYDGEIKTYTLLQDHIHTIQKFPFQSFVLSPTKASSKFYYILFKAIRPHPSPPPKKTAR